VTTDNVAGLVLVAFSDQADGSLLQRGGKVVGSALIGQAFTGLGYFHPRPSAAGAAATGSMIEILDDKGQPTGRTESADPTDLSLVASSASNLGPTNEDFLATVKERVAAYRKLNGLDRDTAVPVDAVTASGSGLDPDISVANARLQAARVARTRNLDRSQVFELIDRYTDGRSLGFLGEEGVNVLRLNLALDKLER
jgi:K+-transporting ATPase ATPase C chain